MPNRLKIIAVGNALRGDDAAGIAVGAELRSRGYDVVESTGEGTEIMDAFDGAAAVVIVDAAQSGSAPGAIVRLDASSKRIPSDFFHYSTHAFSVAEAVELSRVLGELPPHVVIYGIEGRSFEAGAPMTTDVVTSIDRVADRIEDDVLRFTNLLHEPV